MRKTIFVFIVATLLAVVGTAAAQNQRGVVDPQDKPRKVREEADKAFKKWLEDVGPIISDPERKAWDQLQTNEERERFIEAFWRRRDPDPDTETNEYREAYYERIAYVNEHFTFRDSRVQDFCNLSVP